jgi:plastocyanin
VQFTDTSAGSATSWRWIFGDGTESARRNPSHVFPAAGVYPVSLRVTGPGGTTETTQTIEVLPPNTLRLMARTGRAFDVTMSAVDPSNGDAGEGQAVPQNDAFGYFTMPSRPAIVAGAPATPEVFVKMQDARGLGGDYWVFWGGSTDLTYTLTVRDVESGVTKVHHYSAADRPECVGVDTSGFQTTAATKIVNVGQNGNSFEDQSGGGRQTVIRVGDTVQWNWLSGPHTSTSGRCRDSGDPYGGDSCDSDGMWDSGSRSVSSQYSRTFTTAGTYNYFCEVHGRAMTGVVVVQAEGPATTTTPTVTPTTAPGGQAPRLLGNVVSEGRVRESRIVLRPTGSGPVATLTPTQPGPTPTPTPTQPGPTSTPTPTATPPSGGTRVVEVRDIFFRDSVSGGSTTTITVGTTVEWDWEGGLQHSTTSGACPSCTPDGRWDSGTKSSGIFEHTFSETGTFPYFCRVHGSMMTGTVIVNNP